MAVLEDAKSNTLQPIIEETVEPGTTVYTDEFPAYNGLRKAGYEHKRIQHAEKVYVLVDIHTQTVDGFWGNFKNGIRGMHHHVSPEYLQSYLNEPAFRYSHRNDVKPMFLSFLDRIGTEC